MSDPINPDHYEVGGIKVADVADAYDLGRWPFSALKYILRAGRKDPAKTVEDLEKSVWYLTREIGRLKGEKSA